MSKRLGLRLQDSGQSLFAYVLLISVVIMALVMMERYLRRGVQSGVKMAADEIGLQRDSLQMDPTDAGFFDVEQRVRITTEAPHHQRLENLAGAHTLNVVETSEVLYRDRLELRDWEEDN
ncbi:hypothetical protein ACFL2I_03325 [Candidatus Omnitrophota bacterium]